MSQSRRITMTFALLAVALLATGAAVAQSPVSSPEVGAARIEWRPVTDEALELTVSGPAGFYLRQTFAPGDNVVFSAFNEDGSLRPAGTYAFELKANAVLDDQTRAERDAGGVLAKGVSLPAPRMTSGYFSIVDGAFDMGGEEEPGTTAGGATGSPPRTVVLTNADGVIRNSLCVGFDCPNSPVFSDSTILLMENNTRIKFGDTSNAPFPNNDWEIEANSSLSGGAELPRLQRLRHGRQRRRLRHRPGVRGRGRRAPERPLRRERRRRRASAPPTRWSTSTSWTATRRPSASTRTARPASRRRPGTSPATRPTSSSAT